MNLYTAGSGDKTLVFMAGANTPAVIFDFKPLFSRLSEQTLDQALQENEFLHFWLYDMGGYRLYNINKVFPAAASPDLTEAERAEYRAITYLWYSRFYQTAMFREGILTEAQRSDFQAVRGSPVPDVPTLQLLSSDEATFSVMLGENGLQKWRQLHENYNAALTTGRLVQLNCGHYIHVEAPDAVSAEICKFLDEIQ